MNGHFYIGDNADIGDIGVFGIIGKLVIWYGQPTGVVHSLEPIFPISVYGINGSA
jgi:hypothetical protein